MVRGCWETVSARPGDHYLCVSVQLLQCGCCLQLGCCAVPPLLQRYCSITAELLYHYCDITAQFMRRCRTRLLFVALLLHRYCNTAATLPHHYCRTAIFLEHVRSPAGYEAAPERPCGDAGPRRAGRMEKGGRARMATRGRGKYFLTTFPLLHDSINVSTETAGPQRLLLHCCARARVYGSVTASLLRHYCTASASLPRHDYIFATRALPCGRRRRARGPLRRRGVCREERVRLAAPRLLFTARLLQC